MDDIVARGPKQATGWHGRSRRGSCSRDKAARPLEHRDNTCPRDRFHSWCAASGVIAMATNRNSAMNAVLTADEQAAETTVRLDKHSGDSDLGDLDLGAED